MKIAISGYVGTGKTTLAEALYKHFYLKYKIKFQLIIPSFKDLAKSKGISLEEFQEMAKNNPNIDKEFDDFIIKESEKYENTIISTWLAIWTIKDADLKIFLTTDLEQRIKRIMIRDHLSYEKAKESILYRDKQNYERYLNLYGIDISRPFDIADIIINTTNFTVDDEVAIIETALKCKKKLVF
jgi:cytidylate kinase